MTATVLTMKMLKEEIDKLRNEELAKLREEIDRLKKMQGVAPATTKPSALKRAWQWLVDHRPRISFHD